MRGTFLDAVTEYLKPEGIKLDSIVEERRKICLALGELSASCHTQRRRSRRGITMKRLSLVRRNSKKPHILLPRLWDTSS